jgi:hypothetical protein
MQWHRTIRITMQDGIRDRRVSKRSAPQHMSMMQVIGLLVIPSPTLIEGEMMTDFAGDLGINALTCGQLKKRGSVRGCVALSYERSGRQGGLKYQVWGQSLKATSDRANAQHHQVTGEWK